MKIVKDLLIVAVIAVMAWLVVVHDEDLIALKHDRFTLSKAVWMNHCRLQRIEGGLAVGYDLHIPLKAMVLIEADRLTAEIMGATIFDTIYGTGVFVGDDKILTAKHVLKNRVADDRIKIITADKKVFKVKEILEDKNDDLALIILDKKYQHFLKVGMPPRLGDSLICIGSPFSHVRHFIVTKAIVSCEWVAKFKQFIYDGFCFNGCSGGAVISKGKLVGITCARGVGMDSMGFAIPITRLDPEILDRIK